MNWGEITTACVQLHPDLKPLTCRRFVHLHYITRGTTTSLYNLFKSLAFLSLTPYSIDIVIMIILIFIITHQQKKVTEFEE